MKKKNGCLAEQVDNTYELVFPLVISEDLSSVLTLKTIRIITTSSDERSYVSGCTGRSAFYIAANIIIYSSSRYSRCEQFQPQPLPYHYI